ncbi:histone deacetylase family protein [Corticimicrobacter populi]|uniref:Deacetylase n=1 Tax=Corticimicrobacter populi TaxID=2175229 RepID=A0A2V1JX25_9BURK|nr:histone deacetylase family protein [Corticimicrobacter populi]PWF23020.1 deacetylase [Corticimicrobacter populi]
METLYITHPACRLHEMGDWHPESPQRLDAISDQLMASGLADYLAQDLAPVVTREALERIHPAGYIDMLQATSPQSGHRPIDPDTLMNPHTWKAALHAAGAGIAAVDAVMARQSRTAFCAVRPPGHHACPEQAMGFCFFNNIAVAIAHALEVHGLQRVAVIDFDVHHGNGTEAAFAGDERVLMCGFFQHPLYPNVINNHPAANMVNVPVEPYTSGAAVRTLVHRHWLPRLEAHRPEMIFISAGFDAHREDDMGQMTLVEDDYAWLTGQLVEVAEKYAQGRIVSMLEGGYTLSSLGRSVVAHVRVLAKL